MSLANSFRGWFSEKLTGAALWIGLDTKVYRRVANLIIEDSRGTTQLDQLLISPYGIFVIEVKDYNGWIYGTEKQKEWTQCFKSGKKFKFQNPLRQNYRHIQALVELTNLPEHLFHSIIFFTGGGELKTKKDLPDTVMDRGFVPYIKQQQQILLDDETCEHWHQILLQVKDNQISTKEHVTNLQSHHANEKNLNDNPITDKLICPLCSKKLIKKKGKYGDFWGCEGYSAKPRCSYTKKIS